MDAAKNFAKVTLAGPYDDNVTSVDLVTADAVKLPPVPFNVVWWNATDYPDPADDPGVEIVRVTARVDDTLTITRAQENTAASDHNLAGKTYKMIAGLTARMINAGVAGDVFGAGPAIAFDFDIPFTKWRLDDTDTRHIQLDNSGIVVQSIKAWIGDSQAAGNSSVLEIDDNNTRAIFSNLDIATTQSESASGPVGSVVGKLAIRDGSGTILGYLPIYGSIT